MELNWVDKRQQIIVSNNICNKRIEKIIVYYGQTWEIIFMSSLSLSS